MIIGDNLVLGVNIDVGDEVWSGVDGQVNIYLMLSMCKNEWKNRFSCWEWCWCWV